MVGEHVRWWKLGPLAALGAALLGSSPVGSPALGAQDLTGWTLYWENDTFRPGSGTDARYTNGVRYTVDQGSGRIFEGATKFGRWWQRDFLDRERPHQSLVSQVLGQNFFTPAEITAFEVDPTDRPYAGLLYGGVRLEVTDEPSLDPETAEETYWQRRMQHSFELDVGVLGHGALADEVQSAVHVLRQSRIPKGWPHQLSNEPAVSAMYMWRALVGSRFIDVTPHFGGMLGTPQIYAFGGLTARVGWQMSDFPSLMIRNNAVSTRPRSDYELALVAGFEGRGFGRNAFVTGGFREETRLRLRRHGGEYRVGLTARFVDVRFSYTFIRRMPELRGTGPSSGVYHEFGSIQFGYEPGLPNPARKDVTFAILDGVRWLLGEPLFEASIGQEVAAGSDAAQSDMGMHVALGRYLGEHLALTWEITGITREGARPNDPAADHTDRFLVNRPFALRVMPLGRDDRAVVHVRAGVARTATSKLQVTPGEAGPRAGPCPPGTTFDGDDDRFCNRAESGRGYLLGAGLSWDLGGDTSLNFDLAWNRLDVTQDPSFWLWSVGVGWHPGGEH